jgi:hypothetical protein
MDYLFQDGGKPKKTKSKTKTTKTTKTTNSKSSTKTGSKTTKSKTTTKKSSSKKGGNFLGTVGELVAPSGWETFATTAGLFALDRADSALRRGKKTKSSAKKVGMRGGYNIQQLEAIQVTIQEIMSNKELSNFNPNNMRPLVNIRGDYSQFLEAYKIFLQTKKPKNDNSKEIKVRYRYEMWGKLKTMIERLRNILLILQSIETNKNIPKHIIDRFLDLTPEISGIFDFLDIELTKYKLPS